MYAVHTLAYLSLRRLLAKEETFTNFTSVVKVGHELQRFSATPVQFCMSSVCCGFILFYAARIRDAEFSHSTSIRSLLRGRRQFRSMLLYGGHFIWIVRSLILPCRFMTELDINSQNLKIYNGLVRFYMARFSQRHLWTF